MLITTLRASCFEKPSKITLNTKPKKTGKQSMKPPR